MRQNLPFKLLGTPFPIIPFNQNVLTNGIHQIIQVLALVILYMQMQESMVRYWNKKDINAKESHDELNLLFTHLLNASAKLLVI